MDLYQSTLSARSGQRRQARARASAPFSAGLGPQVSRSWTGSRYASEPAGARVLIMSEPRYRDWILETIDSLRSRKARPDLERICRMVRRRHGSEPDQTRSELEKLIQEQAVLKVNYKGSVSYRNAAKVQRKSRKKTAQTSDCAPHARTARDGARTRADRAQIADSEVTGASRPSDPEPSASPAAKRRETTFPPAAEGCGAGERGHTTCRASESGAHRDELPQMRGRKRSLSLDEDAVNDNGTDAPGHAQAARGAERDRDPSTGTGTCASVAAQRKLRHAQRPRTELGPQLGTEEAHGSHTDRSRAEEGDRLAASVPSPANRERNSATLNGAQPADLEGMPGSLGAPERLSEDRHSRSKVKEVQGRELDSARRRRSTPGVVGSSWPERLVSPKQATPHIFLAAVLWTL
ncbi:hypothetical protein Z043_100358 [Scleropages formosus]|uniref:SAMD1-like winged helix (WH) domain-containing protein n=1 Tax=Scleropages formosus TaxID=113540 RepID=A0A0P7XSP0_SCLFO|nr:hypothetical protein Z043_100358 [Scleropages formosus]